MAVAPLEAGKTKIAKRVIEVFEFFASENRRATVMDIVRRYGRPQSSTSELLGALVDMGLLYKDAQTRSYAPTPRLAALGFAAQPEPISGGRLFRFMDRLAQTSRCDVGLFGAVGTRAQVFRWSSKPGRADLPIHCGDSIPLSSGAIGLLLLSTKGQSKAGRILWRLHAEADEQDRFNLAERNQLVAGYALSGQAVGSAGLGDRLKTAAILLPDDTGEHSLALGVFYKEDAAVDADALIATLRHGVEAGFAESDEDTAAAFVRGLRAQ